MEGYGTGYMFTGASWCLAVALIGIAFAVYYVERALRKPVGSKFSTARVDEDDWHGSFMRAKVEFGTEPFYFGTCEKMLILPHHLFEELKNLPESQVSFQDQVTRTLLGSLSGIAMHDLQPLVKSVNLDLTRNMRTILVPLQEEVNFAVDTEIGECKDWTPLPVLSTFQNIVAYASARIFVGPELCRDPSWLEMSLGFTRAVVDTVSDIQATRQILRPFRMVFSSSARGIRHHRQQAHRKLRPLLEVMMRSQKAAGGDQYTGNGELELARWYTKHREVVGRREFNLLLDNILAASFAAIHTTSFTMTNIIFDLAMHPHFVEELRTEISEVSGQRVGSRIAKVEIPKLRKLDSAINESLRMHPISSAATQRVVTAKDGIRLSSGHFLPRGTSFAIGQARQTGDVLGQSCGPQLPSLDEYYPFRFSDLRNQDGEGNKHQLVTTTIENPVFGYGRHACPGRFFASNEIKTILIELLMRYDLALAPDNESRGTKLTRPATPARYLGYYPDEKAKVYFRNRT